MQKKIIALAIAGLASSAAFAQTNVTIYGVLDIGYANYESDQTAPLSDAKFSGMANAGLSGNRLGFRVNEDLGNNLSAIGLLELGSLSPDGGGVAGGAGISGAGSVRTSYVGLKHNTMGTLQAGRIYSTAHNYAVKYDAEGAAVFGPISRITGSLALSTDGSGNNNARVNNSIAWLSPNWSGFTAQVQYAFGENGEQNATAATGNGGDDARMWGLGMDYTNGPLAVGFSYNDWSDYGGTGSAAASVERELTEWFIGGSYDFGVVKLFGSYQDFEMDNMTTAALQAPIAAAATGTAGASSDGDIWALGLIVPVMKVGAITLSYASLDRQTRTGTAAARLGADADGWGISYKHNLSKRTTAYIGYTTLSNDNKANPLSILSIGNVATPSAGGDASGYMMGVRHTF